MRTGFYLLSSAILSLTSIVFAQDFRPEIPRVWDDKEVAGFEMPLAQRDRSPRYMTAAEYYALKVRPIYRSYPVYARGREPVGYRESLMHKEPEIIFDASKLRTKEDWVRAGKLVFESWTAFRPAPEVAPAGNAQNMSADGVIHFYRGQYTIRKKGILEVAAGSSCAACHTRVMPDGSLFEGAQGTVNIPFSAASPPISRAD